jgi:NADH-quinone oxidoreductase subunit J
MHCNCMWSFSKIEKAFSCLSSNNPIYSVLLLVLIYLSAAVIFFMLQLEFLPLVLVFVYIGAIAILCVVRKWPSKGKSS